MTSGRFAEHWPSTRDVALTLLVAVICMAVTVGFQDESSEGRDFGAVAALLTVVACAPIAFRRSVPVATAVVALSVALLGVVLDYPMTGAILVGLGLVGLATSRAEVRMTGTLGVFSGAVIATIAAMMADDYLLIPVISGIAVGMLPALVGERLRGERVRSRDARELARRVEELRDRDVQRAVTEERLRIVRDVHDITGHHLSAIALQSAGAGRTTSDPVARASFERIHGLTAEALGQTRRALGVLRHESEPAALAPPPRLAHVGRLLEPARAAGIHVDLRIDGSAHELSETVEMCAYRVIQESLTNVVRHAGATSAQIVLGYGDDALTVTVSDDGPGGHGGPTRNGSGIEGMRERVALVGGAFAAGPRDAGGWSVHATLPLERPR
jgi:signal transduction histidine kinase